MQKMKKLTDGFQLSNGVSLPCVGYGTWQTPDGEIASKSVKLAIEAGYRHIDCAAVYANEASVGRGIKASGIPRNELFITSKVWNTERGYDKTIKAFEKTLSDLQLDYLDLYLIHWPANSKQFSDWDSINLDTWRAMTDLYKAGKVRAIGVSNFQLKHLRSLLETEVKPMVNQIRFHPGMMQQEIVSFCKENGLTVEAWSPLGQGKVLSDPTLQEIADRYGKSTAQVCIKWCLQHDICPLPKSVTPDRIKANADVFDYILTDDDMTKIDRMDRGEIVDSDNIDF
jgi:diketogulonate reductase-like aldo/keto reductase